MPWRPMSTFKKELGDVDPQQIVLFFQDTDLREVVKLDFIDAAVARGGALLGELKDEVRNGVEPQLIRAIEGPTTAPDRQGGGTPDEAET